MTIELKPCLVQQFKECFDYDLISGQLFWKAGSRKRFARSRFKAGSIDSKGRLRIEFKKRSYAAGAIVFALFYGRLPKGQIDHINQNKLDNRIQNLRECTNAENSRNRKSRNPLGKGVSYHRGRYIARIMKDGVTRHLGCFKDKESALKAYKEASIVLHGDFACPTNF
jgi:hypothetical protein